MNVPGNSIRNIPPLSESEPVSATPKDHASNYDYCLILPSSHVSEGSTLPKSSSDIVQTLQRQGFDVFVYRAVLSQQVVVLIKCQLHRLRTFASYLNYPMLLDPENLQIACTKGKLQRNIRPFTISHFPEVARIPPYEYIYVKYSDRADETLYWRDDDADNPFRELIRLKLTPLIIQSHSIDRPGINIGDCLRDGSILGFFPLHNPVRANEIFSIIQNYPRKPLDIDEIREYLGEKIALQFALIEHIATFMIIPSMIGVPLQLLAYFQSSFVQKCSPFYAYMISLWSIFILEYWKRKEKRLIMRWGLHGFEESEVDRSEFRGEIIKSYINGSNMKYFPTHLHSRYSAQSSLIVSILLLIVVVSVAVIYFIRSVLARTIGPLWAQITASTLNAIEMVLANYIYNGVATWLTDQENHRTETQYDDNLIIKIFVFQFINSYTSFFYLAFIAKFTGGCVGNECMTSLSVNLAVVFGAMMLTGQVYDGIKYFISYIYRRYFNEYYLHGKRVAISRPEKEYLLTRHTHTERGIFAYGQNAICFGYTALFVTALPVAALLSYICMIFSIRLEGMLYWKLLSRPIPHGSEDIGNWQYAYLILTIASVVTNAGLAVFTMTVFDNVNTNIKYWIFILFQWTCFALQAFVMAIIPDIPEEILIQAKRASFISKKLIDQVADDTYDIDGNRVIQDIAIKSYPDDLSLDAKPSMFSSWISPRDSDKIFFFRNNTRKNSIYSSAHSIVTSARNLFIRRNNQIHVENTNRRRSTDKAPFIEDIS